MATVENAGQPPSPHIHRTFTLLVRRKVHIANSPCLTEVVRKEGDGGRGLSNICTLAIITMNRRSNEQGNWKQDTEGQQRQLPACPSTKTIWYPNGDKEQNHKLHLPTNTHKPVLNLDYDQASGAQNYNLRNEMLKKSCQQGQNRHDPQHQDQRNGRNKEHPSSYPTAEDQMVWTPHKTTDPTPSSACI